MTITEKDLILEKQKKQEIVFLKFQFVIMKMLKNLAKIL
jgi:hypothetical protein